MRFGTWRSRCVRYRIHTATFAAVALFASCLLSSQKSGCAADVKGRVGYSIAMVSPSGTYAYVPGTWGVLHLNLVNPSEEPVSFLAATYFDGAPTLQYGRRVWLPPRSRMKTWHPILLPGDLSDGKRRFDFHTMVMQSDEGREVLIRSDTGYLQLDGTLKTVDDRPVTGLLDRTEMLGNEDDTAAFDLVMACRLTHQHRRHIANLSAEGAPPGEESLHALDQLVIAGDRVLTDAAGIDSIRRWLYGGGRLWVMLDRVGPEFLERLLGDNFSAEVVDRVELTSVNIESRLSAQGTDIHREEFENPVEFVRMLVDGVDVVSSVDGWPAAWWKTCGDGRLLVTTLGPRAWMRLRKPPDVPPMQPGQKPPTTGRPNANRSNPGPAEAPGEDLGKFAPIDPMSSLSSVFLEKRVESRLPTELLESQVQQYVGYSIPSQSIVVSLLLGFALILAATGAWLWRIGRLEWLGVIGPAASIAIAAVLILFGRQQRDAVPPSVASVQFVQVLPGTDDIRAEGIAGIYSPDSGDAEISAVRGGWFIPELAGTDGQTRRMIWTDLDTWRWENFPQAAGLRSARFQESQSLGKRVEARARFGPTGLSGRLTIDSTKPADPIIATRFGRMGVDLAADGTFNAAADRAFAADQFIGSTLLSDEQNRRSAILQTLLGAPDAEDADTDDPVKQKAQRTKPERRDYPDAPQLLFWTDPWDLGFHLGGGRREFGSALVAVPLQLERPATGTEVAIPAPLLSFRDVHGPDGVAPSGLYDHRKRLWGKKADPSTSWFRIQVPEVLLPVELIGGRISVKVSGPVGKLEIAGIRGNAPVSARTWMDPVGTLTLDLTETEIFPVADDGGLLIRLSGGDPARPELTRSEGDYSAKANYWKIESLDVELRVRTLPSSESAAVAPGN